ANRGGVDVVADLAETERGGDHVVAIVPGGHGQHDPDLRIADVDVLQREATVATDLGLGEDRARGIADGAPCVDEADGQALGGRCLLPEVLEERVRQHGAGDVDHLLRGATGPAGSTGPTGAASSTGSTGAGRAAGSTVAVVVVSASDRSQSQCETGERYQPQFQNMPHVVLLGDHTPRANSSSESSRQG